MRAVGSATSLLHLLCIMIDQCVALPEAEIRKGGGTVLRPCLPCAALFMYNRNGAGV